MLCNLVEVYQCSFGTLVNFYQTTRYHSPEDNVLHSQHYDNLDLTIYRFNSDLTDAVQLWESWLKKVQEHERIYDVLICLMYKLKYPGHKVLHVDAELDWAQMMVWKK
jgi:hypothetical protein